jgi:hypothetical protein
MWLPVLRDFATFLIGIGLLIAGVIIWDRALVIAGLVVAGLIGTIHGLVFDTRMVRRESKENE